RADCTTRNKRRAARLQANYDQLETRIGELAAQEDLARVRPDLDGNQIMELLGIPAGPQVGEAWNFLKELRLDRGPLSNEEATAELLAWWRARGAPEEPGSLVGDLRGDGVEHVDSLLVDADMAAQYVDDDVAARGQCMLARRELVLFGEVRQRHGATAVVQRAEGPTDR